MKFIRTDIPEVVIIEPNVFIDERGYFSETFRQDLLDEFLEENINFCQDNESMSQKGVLRGLHFQLPPFAQSKLVRVIKGKVLDVAVDIRKGSPTFGQHVSVELSETNKRQLYIPKGFAHGFVVLSNSSIFSYKVDAYWNPDSEGAIAWNDPALNIDWKLPEDALTISEKDLKNPLLEHTPMDFDYHSEIRNL